MDLVDLCYCGSNRKFESCCESYILKREKAPTAEALMRSRYSAYATHHANYLLETTHISTRNQHEVADILDWSKSNNWIKLEVLNSSYDHVEFKAYYTDDSLQPHVHHEKSAFAQEDGYWFYVDGEFF